MLIALFLRRSSLTFLPTTKFYGHIPGADRTIFFKVRIEPLPISPPFVQGAASRRLPQPSGGFEALPLRT
jgi:hypothetical protein